MQEDFWHERWHLGQIGFHQDVVNPHLQQYWDGLGVPAASRVFVPLCGKSTDMLWLRALGHEVIGVELSPLAVQSFFAEHGLPGVQRRQGRFDVFEAEGIKLFCGDFFDLGAEDLAGVAAVYDRASLVALPPAMRSSYAAHMHGLLAPGVRTLLVAFEYPQHEMAGPPFSVGEQEIQALYGEHCRIERLHSENIIAREARFRERGISHLEEKVYALTYNADFS